MFNWNVLFQLTSLILVVLSGPIVIFILKIQNSSRI